MAYLVQAAIYMALKKNAVKEMGDAAAETWAGASELGEAMGLKNNSSFYPNDLSE